MELGDWLRSLGLEQYEAVFRENAIDPDVLCDLTEEHLRELGVPRCTQVPSKVALRPCTRAA